MQIKTIWCFCTMCTLLLAGCSSVPSDSDVRGRISNNDRMLRSIPIIPDGWVGSNGVTNISWSNPAFADPTTAQRPMHARKYSYANRAGHLLRETDFYYSGKKYRSEFESDQTDWEELSISYNFEAAHAGKEPWRCVINCGPHYRRATNTSMVDGQVTLEEAEKILDQWGIRRLNY